MDLFWKKLISVSIFVTVFFVLLILGILQVDGQSACPPLQLPLYGEFPIPCSNNIGDRCNFGCERGFELLGSCHRVCCSNQNWTGSPARCINCDIPCPPLFSPLWRATLDNEFDEECKPCAGFTCKFKCNSGQEPDGSLTTSCLKTGMWSDPPPTCAPVTPRNPLCYDVNPPLNGGARGECVNASTNQTCRFDCDPGYSLSGASSITCLPSGWNSIPPTCFLITCSNQTEPTDDTGRLEGQCMPGLGGQTCSIQCNPGLQPGLVGNATITCEDNSMWSDVLAKCEPILCENRPTRIPFGRGSGNCMPGLALHTCVYECDEGFAITGGSSVLLCETTGNWTGTVPICSRILCQSIQTVPLVQSIDGQCDPGYAGSSCTVTCGSGYTPLQPKVLNCTVNGTWDGDAQVCTEIHCPPVYKPENAVLETGSYSVGEMEFRESHCEPGIAGLYCAMTCLQGYLTVERQPGGEIKCDEFGVWVGQLPDCVRTTCDPIQKHDHVSAVSDGCISALSNEECSVECERHYSGGGTIACSPEGVWSGDIPPCVQVRCVREHRLPPGGNWVRSGKGCIYKSKAAGYAGESCVYTCNSGYALTGPSSVFCTSLMGEEEGRYALPPNWPPTCIQILCPVPPTVDDSEGWISPASAGPGCASTGNNNIGSRCQLKCNEEFRPNVSSITCTASGVWSGLNPDKPPGCIKIDKPQCLPLITGITNGMTSGSCRPGFVDDMCTFMCNYGYALVGSKELKCKAVMIGNAMTARWDKPLPFCRVVYCPALQTPTNGYLTGQCSPGDPGAACFYHCLPTYALQGTEMLVCQGNGQWSTTPPTCGRNDCPALVPPQPGGYMQGTCQPGRAGEICTFFCPFGYRILGSTNLLCLGSGEWNGVVPQCIRSGSPVNPTDPSGTDPSNPGDDPTRRPGSCPPRRRCCPGIRPPRFGVVFGIVIGSPCSFEVGSICNVRCSSGFSSASPASQMTMTCMRNRRWNSNGGSMSTMRCSRRRTEDHFRPWINVRTNETRKNG